MEDGAAYEMDTLPPAAQPRRPAWAQSRPSRRHTTGKLAAIGFIFFLPSVLVAVIIVLTKGTNSAGHSAAPLPLLPFPTCEGDSEFTNSTYMFFPRSWFMVREELDIPNFVGKIHFAPERQYHGGIPIFAEVQFRFSSVEDINRIQVDQWIESPEGTAGLVLRLKDPLDRRPFSRCLSANIIIQAYRWNYFSTLQVSTTKSSIEIGHGARFDTPNVRLSSGSGNIACARAYDYDTEKYNIFQNTRIESGSGSILGEWALGLSMFMKVFNGDIKAKIKPYLWETGPKMPADLTVENVGTGNIDISMPTDPRELLPRAYTANIVSQAGNISGSLIHGVETTLNAKNGAIDVTLLPYNVDTDTRSVIRTESRYGDTRVHLLKGVTDNVMNRTWSRHDVGGGTMAHCCEPGSLWLQYPPDWNGHFAGMAKNGSLTVHVNENGKTRDFVSEKDPIVEGTERVSLVKGIGDSDMNFWVGHGQADIRVGF